MLFWLLVDLSDAILIYEIITLWGYWLCFSFISRPILCNFWTSCLYLFWKAVNYSLFSLFLSRGTFKSPYSNILSLQFLRIIPVYFSVSWIFERKDGLSMSVPICLWNSSSSLTICWRDSSYYSIIYLCFFASPNVDVFINKLSSSTA